MQPPARRRNGALAGTRMSAAGIRPQSTGVIFLGVALLQHDPPAVVHDEDREGAMQETTAMNGRFSGRPGGAVAFVNQNELFLGHQHSISGRASASIVTACLL